MRLLPLFLVISLASVAVSCKTYDRQQYSYSYRAPVHVAQEKQTPPPEAALNPASPSAPAAPSATAPSAPAAPR